MNIDASLLDKCKANVEKSVSEKSPYWEGLYDLVLLHDYGQECLSQFGVGLVGWSIRQKGLNHLLTVKVIDSGTPLVGYITSATPTGCVEQLFYMLESEKMRWHRDQYPWS